MSRVAVFVDAGYLFAQGSAALTGSKKPRALLKLNEAAVLTELSNLAYAKSNCNLLRVYWYDGALGSRGPTLEQQALAYMDHIKLRLGFVSSRGQQKGVDSLIVTDLIDLARNHAITDAMLLSGDEDVRIGVQIAQGFGVRVHLVGIAPSRGSQSLLLLQEADTTTEWDAPIVGKFLSVKAALAVPVVSSPAIAVVAAVATGPASVLPVGGAGTMALSLPATHPHLDAIVVTLVAALDTTEVSTLKSYWSVSRGIPIEYDGKLLARGRAAIGQNLDVHEKRYIRAQFIASVKAI